MKQKKGLWKKGLVSLLLQGFFVSPAKMVALSELLPRVGVGGQNNSNPPTSDVMRIDMWGAGWHLTILLRL